MLLTQVHSVSWFYHIWVKSRYDLDCYPGQWVIRVSHFNADVHMHACMCACMSAPPCAGAGQQRSLLENLDSCFLEHAE